MGFANQTTQQGVPYPYAVVFETLLKVIPETGMALKENDKVLGRIIASTGMSLFSWGENIAIVVEKRDDNSCVVAIDSALKLGSNIAGAHRHQKNFNMIISALGKRLQETMPVQEESTGADDAQWLARAFKGLSERLSSAPSDNVAAMRSMCVEASDALAEIQRKLESLK
jgi:hypothetical protein